MYHIWDTMTNQKVTVVLEKTYEHLEHTFMFSHLDL
jgi:hypothetical protein